MKQLAEEGPDRRTYLHDDEPGTTLKAAGWVFDGMTDGGEHSRPSRPRQPGLNIDPKQRWWAPWSARAPRMGGRAPHAAD